MQDVVPREDLFLTREAGSQGFRCAMIPLLLQYVVESLCREAMLARAARTCEAAALDLLYAALAWLERVTPCCVDNAPIVRTARIEQLD